MTLYITIDTTLVKRNLFHCKIIRGLGKKAFYERIRHPLENENPGISAC